METYGTGEPILFLHGFTGDHTTWKDTIAALPPNMFCIMPDLLGHGKSDSPSDPKVYGMENAAEDLLDILDHLKIAKTHLVGYSMGGRLALSFALLHKERIISLLLESASPGLESKEERDKRAASDERLAELIEEQGMLEFVDYWENIPLFHTQKKLLPEQQEKIRNQRLANSECGLANSLRGMGTGRQPSWWEALEGLDIPVLLMTGELDKKFCMISEKMKNRLQKSEERRISGVGHAIHVENSAIFGKIVSEFVEKWREK
ncbi:2-succinyl-6-hydroxy-2,4-cyclohexadiene-1-carboxylate synthase [Bacillus sp. 1P06AnD]|uniref:2-succinyl-6-hydroxy-2, 4-cyclohexadiene-1-carboxylate synthase n=1 Tax=Bacillus sp. 1P06AnD TaxID=3132208 RepID=UPI0039A29E2D